MQISAISALLLAIMVLTGCNSVPHEVAVLSHPAPVNAIAILPNGKYLAAGCTDGTLLLWNLESKKVVRSFKGHTDNIISVSVSPDGGMLLSCAQDATCRLWNIESGQEVKRIDALYPSVSPVASISPDGHLFAMSDFEMNRGATIRIWNLQTRTEITRYLWDKGVYEMGTASFSPDSRTLAVPCISSDPEKLPHLILVWDLRTNELLHKISLGERQPRGIDFSYDGRQLLVGLSEGVGLWDVSTERQVRLQPNTFWAAGGITNVRYAPDGRRFMAAGPRKLAEMYDATTFKPIRGFNGNGEMSFTSDGKYIAMIRDDLLSYTVRVWRLSADPLR